MPSEFQGDIMGSINQRRGMITNSEVSPDGGASVVQADVPLANLFGYSTDVRSQTQGKGEFTMERRAARNLSRTSAAGAQSGCCPSTRVEESYRYKQHVAVVSDAQAELIKAYKEAREAGEA